MSEQRPTLTREGYNRIKEEIKRIDEEMKELTVELSDYHEEIDEDEALDFQANMQRSRLEERIDYLRRVVANPIIVDKDPDPGVVSIGNEITLRADDGDTFTAPLLSQAEIILGMDGIAVDSPIGRAIHNRRKGDKVVVNAPDGKITYTIKEID